MRGFQQGRRTKLQRGSSGAIPRLRGMTVATSGMLKAGLGESA